MKTLYKPLLFIVLFLGCICHLQSQCFTALSDDTPLNIDGSGTSTSSCQFSPNTATLDFTGNASQIGVDITGSISISISHTYSSDLEISLISPNGTELNLASNLGGPSDNAYLNTSFSDSGLNISDATAPFTGSYIAEGGPFEGTFYGESLDGIWTLKVCDNYNEDSGIIENFSMEFCAILNGCLDPIACNFSGLGTGGPCVYPVYAIPTDLEDFGPVVVTCPDAVPDGYVIASDQCCVQERIDVDPYCINNFWDNICYNFYLDCVNAGSGCEDIGGCTDKCAPNFNTDATEDDGSCEEYETCPAEDDCFTIYDWDTSTCTCTAIIIDYFCDDDNECTFDYIDTETCECVFEPIEGCPVTGCTYANACNFNPEATDDDGSCIFDDPAYFIPEVVSGGPILIGCSGSLIDGYVEAENQCCVQERIDFDSYCIETNWDNICNNAYLECLEFNAECNAIPGCIDQCAPNYNPEATEDDGSCEEYFTCPESTCTSIFEYDPESCSCFEIAVLYNCDDENACTFDYLDTELCVCINAPIEGCGLEILGCTYLDACNYNPTATEDDGSCNYPGCLDPTALNHDSDANCDIIIGSCVYDTGSCPGDFNGDGFINVVDLSGFLGVFGTPCAPID